MKKTNYLVPLTILVILMFLIPAVSAQSKGVPSLLQIISDKLDSIKSVLEGILFEVEEISDKDTTVNVNVEPPIINLTLPDKECEWENYNFVEDNLGIGIDNFNCCGFSDYNGTLQLIPGVSYDEVIPISGRVEAECTGDSNDCKFFVNGIKCGTIPRDNSAPKGTQQFEFNQACLDTMHSGFNTLTMSIPSHTGGRIHKYYLETQIKPTNC